MAEHDLIQTLITTLDHLLTEKKQLCAVAESCTGGLISAAITAYPGSSAWFDCGFVTYSNHAKHLLLGVQQQTLDRFGAVSKETAQAMAEGALQHSQADLSVAVTGIAGPSGGSPNKPVGTIWFAWARKHHPTQITRHHIQGSRTDIRQQAVIIALEGLLALARQA